jgi:hypothetical protein
VALDFTLVLRAETAAAKAELEAAARGIQGVSSATDKATTASKAGATAAQGEAAARRAAAQANQAYTRSTQMAAGATGNLVAQFNDIGMMLAAGQNPLQLAIQQGTQITQVIGPMGAAGAVKALGGALVGMINPISLITIGVIAASGYMLQWLTAAGPEVDAVTAALERQKAALEGIVDETERLRLARGMMLTGAQSQDEQIVLEEINRLTEARAAAQERLNSLTEMGGRAAGFAEQAAAARDVLSAEIAGYDAKIAALNAQREQNAQTAEALDLAGQVRSATAGIATALQAADGSNLQAAFSSAFPLASQLLGMAQGIVSTIGAAQAFQSAETGELSAQYAQYGAGRTIGERLARESGSLYGGKSVLPAARVPGSAGGGGGGAARDQASALQELITGLEGEIAALRTTSPIQEEMLRHREALAGATDAERQQVEALIATREREALLMEGARERAEFFESLGEQALESLIVKGESFNDVLKNIVQSLIQAGIQGALFGSGPFGSLFGGGSIFSGIFGGGKAAGGMVFGPGTGTSDSILTPLSNGEYVVNAKATARNRQLLEAINSGARVGSGLAAGGPAGGADGGTLTGRSGRQMPAMILMDLRGVEGDLAIEQKIRKGSSAMISAYDREGIPVAFQRVSRDQKRRG